MIRTIRLTNYMSHADTALELADGLTVLVGPNNCGKSAVVSALEAVVRGQPGEFMLRHGAKSCEVTVETSDGHAVTWKRKRNGAPSYVVDGVDHVRVQRSVPEEVHAHLRMPEVETEDGKRSFEIHFGKQKEPIFLLGDSESAAATFFAASSDASRLIQMQHVHRERTKERRRRHAEVKRALEQADREAASLASVGEVRGALAAAQAAEGALAQAQADAQRLAGLIGRVGTLARSIERARGRAQALAAVHPPPDLAPTSDLERSIARIVSTTKRAATARAHAAALAALAAPPELTDAMPLTATLASLTRVSQRIATRRTEQASIERSLAAAAEDIVRWACENPTCPTCRGPVDPARLL